MTGIERLRKLARIWTWDCKVLVEQEKLADIADKIERERACDGDTAENIRLIVGGVIDEMERHVSGVEGMEDSPVARWARELRAALGGDVRDPAADVSVSAYDLLPQEDREAIAWVRYHGGRDEVRMELDNLRGAIKETCARLGVEHTGDLTADAQGIWRAIDRLKSLLGDSVPRAAYERHLARRQRQIDESHAALQRRRETISELNHRACDLTRENAEMRPRLMPDGMCWPVFESGEPVMLGDSVTEYVAGGEFEVRSIEFRDGAVYLRECYKTDRITIVRPGERVKRPAPKVLDADGVEIHVGDTVWATNGHGPFEVTRTVYADRLRVICDDEKNGHLNAYPEMLTHRAPVLAADGKPLREGETVWYRDHTDPLEVRGISTTDSGAHYVKAYNDYEGEVSAPAKCFTHERPVADTWGRLEEDVASASCPDVYCVNHHVDASDTSYEWAMARDILRRAKKLAERGQ